MHEYTYMYMGMCPDNLQLAFRYQSDVSCKNRPGSLIIVS